MEYTLYILGFDFRFRIPPRRFCFVCLVLPPLFACRTFRCAPWRMIFFALRTVLPNFFPPFAPFTAPPARPFSTLPHPSSALFRRSPLPNSGFSPLAPFPNSIFSPPAAPFFPPFPRKFAAPFGKVKALLRASPPELRIGPTPTSALPRLLLRPQSSRHRFYDQNASCRFTMQSQLRQKNIQKNL